MAKSILIETNVFSENKKVSRRMVKSDSDKKQNAGNFELFQSEASTYQAIGEYKKAAYSYSKALEIKPGDKDCLTSRGKCFYMLNMPEKALDDVNDIEFSDSQYVKSLLIKADCLHRLMQFEFALMYYHRGLKLRPEMVQFKEGVLRAREAIDNSIGEKSGLKLSATVDLPNLSEDLRFQVYKRSEEKNKDEKKMQGLVAVIDDTKESEEKNEKTSDSKLETKPNTTTKKSTNPVANNEEAWNNSENEETSNENTLDADPISLNIPANTNNAMTTLRDELETPTEELKSNKSGNAKTYKKLLGELYKDRAFLEDLLKETDKRKMKVGNSPVIRKTTIKALNFLEERSGFWQQQKPLLKQNTNSSVSSASSSSSFHKNPDVQNEISNVNELLKKKNYEETVLACKRIIDKRNLEDCVEKELYFCMAEAYFNIKKYNEAKPNYEKCHQNKVVMGRLGKICVLQSQYKEAIVNYKKCLSASAQNRTVKVEKYWLLNEIGMCYFKLGNIQKAQKYGETLMKESDDDDVWKMHACILVSRCREENKQYVTALRTYKKSLNILENIHEENKENFRHSRNFETFNYTETEESEEKIMRIALRMKIDELETILSDEMDGKNEEIDKEDSDDSDKSISSLSLVSSSSSSLTSTIKQESQNIVLSRKTKKSLGKQCPRRNDGEDDSGKEYENDDGNDDDDSKDFNDSDDDDDDDDDEKGDQDRDEKNEQNKKKKKERKKKMLTYNISTRTGNMFMAGTDAKVSMVIYGKYGKTQKLYLNQPINNEYPFEQGKIDKFIIEAEDVGTIKQLRLSHEGRQMGVGWFLEEVHLSSAHFEEIYHFFVHRWFSRFDEDGKTERTVLPTSVLYRPPVTYTISIKTGRQDGAGTNSNVYVVLYGKYLKTTLMMLKMNSFNSVLFEEGSVDWFKVSGTDVGTIEKIKVGIDGRGQKSSWFLEEATVKTSNNHKRTYIFEVGQWFGRYSRDRLVEREFAPTRIVKSSKKNHKKNQNGRNFNRKPKEYTASSDSESYDDDEDDGSDENDKKNGCKKKASKSKNTKKKDNEYTEKSPKIVKYTVAIKTGDKMASGTDADVFVQFFGDSTVVSERIKLVKSDSNSDAFEKGKVDVFHVKAPYIENLSRIRLGHNDAHMASGWYVEKVEVTSLEKIYEFNVEKWFDRDEGDGKIERDLRPNNVREKFDVKTLEKDKSLRSKKDSSNKGSSGSGGANKKNELRDDEQPNYDENNNENSDKEPKAMLDYIITVKTGDKFRAGTDSKVCVQFFGDRKETEKFQLTKELNTSYNNTVKEKKLKSTNKNLFEKGNIDVFLYKGPEIGKVTKLSIGHDGTKLGSGWYLRYVKLETRSNDKIDDKIHNENEDITYMFNVDRWLDKKEGDGRIEVEVEPTIVV